MIFSKIQKSSELKQNSVIKKGIRVTFRQKRFLNIAFYYIDER